MLNSIRKFSSTIYAKVLIAIVILPFVLWGMGDVFRGGSQNTLLEIDKKKIPTKSFINYINQNVSTENFNEELFDKILGSFIAKNLIQIESENLKIDISDVSLLKLIKNNELFKKDNKFDRAKYEKFLITNNLVSSVFEERLKDDEIKKQLINFISGGVRSPTFLINKEYDSENQIRELLVLDLNAIYKNDFNFTEEEVKIFYEENIEKFSESYRSVKYFNLTPAAIIGENEYNNYYFQKIDEIEDEIISGKEIDTILKKYNLTPKTSDLFNKNGLKLNESKSTDFTEDLILDIFKIDLSNPVVLLNNKEDYFIVQLEIVDTIPRKITSQSVKEEILLSLKRELIVKNNSDILRKILTNEFKKTDFNNLANEKNVKIKNVELKNIFDSTSINEEIIKNVYKLPKNKMYIFTNDSLKENLLIYVENIENKKIDKKSDKYAIYAQQTNSKTIDSIFGIYDKYLKNKYNVDINYKAIDKIKNYFK